MDLRDYFRRTGSGSCASSGHRGDSSPSESKYGHRGSVEYPFWRGRRRKVLGKVHLDCDEVGHSRLHLLDNA